MIDRKILTMIKQLGGIFPVVAITGPRQIGKTTLAKLFASNTSTESLYLDLESARDFDSLTNAPQLFLESINDKLVIIDEVQRMKTLFPLLRHLADKSELRPGYILLGSASPDMIRGSSETLAGRIGYIELGGLMISEVGENNFLELWHRGGFPRPFMINDDEQRNLWFKNFFFTYVQRDLPSLGIPAPPDTVAKLTYMLTQFNGKLLHLTDLSKALGISVNTVKSYVNFLEQAYLIRILQPWHNNTNIRLVKTPKIYFRDTGLLHYLIQADNIEQMFLHPHVGFSFETFAIEQIHLATEGKFSLHFYKEHAAGEMDLLITNGSRILAAIEFKMSESAPLSKFSHYVINRLKPEKIFVITTKLETPVPLNNNMLKCSLSWFLTVGLSDLR